MKKTVMNLAIVSCFAFGLSVAHASTHDTNGHGAAASDDGHSHATSDAYFKKATVSGQTQNVQVDAKGVRLPYNMAQDLPSVGESDHGVRAMHGQPNPLLVARNVAKPKIESNNFHCMAGANNPSGSCYNVYPTSSGRNYYQGR
ncbi:conserved exported hypothetical protein [Candidatus Nitrotoga sp. HW29]|uniref:hypothetical protein n=1 Tax=Candidatus Nitrotoga sp. HW29 TaxID=2886963 RepID=UPI001EF3B51E|nr:hypothetical protein [Candidatus Nitrotoga sp. HW29]CAH1905301.1 conserved exported hypothetical protein [Candidatus Nitrotoga sp. HW29]